MNKYGLALRAPSTQTILPALTRDGLIKGWYPITQQTFTGAETSYVLSDGTVVPITTVTVDSTSFLKQYVAAVWPIGLPFNLSPWASSVLVKPDDGYFRFWSLPTETWFLHYGQGVFLDGISSSLNRVGAGMTPGSTAPAVITPGAQTWKASIGYDLLLGNCPFFDFNWVQQFTNSGETKPIRITVLTNPTPIAPSVLPPLIAKVIGIPTAIKDGTLYDTIRILKTAETIPAGTYVFTFSVTNEAGQSSPVTFNLQVL